MPLLPTKPRSTASVPGGRVSVVTIDGGIVEVIFSGRLDESAIHSATTLLAASFAQHPARAVLFNTLQVSGYDASVRAPGIAMLTDLKKRGDVRAVAAASSPAMRMIGSALSLASGFRIEFFETHLDALERARALSAPSR